MKEFLAVTHADYAKGILSDNPPSDPIASADELDNLAPGAIAIFDEAGNVIDATSVVSSDRIYMAVGMPTGSPWITSLIDRRTLEYNGAAYAAPVAKIMAIGEGAASPIDISSQALRLPTLAAGQIATVVIYDLSHRKEEVNKTARVYHYTVQTGDNDQAVVEGLRDIINADSKRIVNAAPVDTDSGIQFTAITAGKDFNVEGMGILVSADVGTSTALVKGHGTSAQVKELAELAANVRRGKQNSFLYTNELWGVESNIATADTFNIITLNWANQTQDGSQLHQPTYKKELVIAVKNNALFATLGNILAVV